MTYEQLVRLYFERSTALQWYWTLYVVVVGGLLAFCSIRKERDIVTSGLVTVLFCFFAYKNLDAIHDVIIQRLAVVGVMDQSADGAGLEQVRGALEPTLVRTPYEGTRNFHVVSDLLTIAAVWAMELRRWRANGPGTRQGPGQPRGG